MAESSSVVPSKASVAMNSDIVKPMPPSQAQPCSAVQLTPSGSDASRKPDRGQRGDGNPERFADDQSQDHGQRHTPLRPIRSDLTPAFENAKSGITTKAESP